MKSLGRYDSQFFWTTATSNRTHTEYFCGSVTALSARIQNELAEATRIDHEIIKFSFSGSVDTRFCEAPEKPSFIYVIYQPEINEK